MTPIIVAAQRGVPGAERVVGSVNLSYLSTYEARVPKVTKVCAWEGAEIGRTSVTLIGVNFAGATEVAFAGLPANILERSATTLRVSTPGTETEPIPEGWVDVTVTNGVGASFSSPAARFEYEELPAEEQFGSVVRGVEHKAIHVGEPALAKIGVISHASVAADENPCDND